MKAVRILLRGVFLVAVLAAALGAATWGLSAAWSDAGSLKARWKVNQWRDGHIRMPALGEWEQMRQQLIKAREITPDNAQIHDDLGFIHAMRAQAIAGNADLADLYQALLAEAEQHYREAVRRRPMFPYGWAHLALTLHYQGKRDAAFWQAYDTAYAWGKNESGVQRILGEIAFANWSGLGTERERAMRDLVANGAPHVKKDLVALAAGQGVVLDVGVTP